MEPKIARLQQKQLFLKRNWIFQELVRLNLLCCSRIDKPANPCWASDWCKEDVGIPGPKLFTLRNSFVSLFQKYRNFLQVNMRTLVDSFLVEKRKYYLIYSFKLLFCSPWNVPSPFGRDKIGESSILFKSCSTCELRCSADFFSPLIVFSVAEFLNKEFQSIRNTM